MQDPFLYNTHINHQLGESVTTNEYIILAIAAYFATFALVVNTRGFMSAVVFKVIPFFSAVALGLIVFKLI